MNKLLFILCFIGFASSAFATGIDASIFDGGSTTGVVSQKGKYPAVFLINDNSDAFEKLSLEYPTSLMGACSYDMDSAYTKWMDFVVSVEKYADQNDFDIKGVKMWIKVFWSKDGAVDHIAYHLKPVSRNINTDSLTDFFERFVAEYTLSLITESPYSHYGVATYPTFYRPVLKE